MKYYSLADVVPSQYVSDTVGKSHEGNGVVETPETHLDLSHSSPDSTSMSTAFSLTETLSQKHSLSHS